MNYIKVIPLDQLNEMVRTLSEENSEPAFHKLAKLAELLTEQEAAYRAVANVLKNLLDKQPK